MRSRVTGLPRRMTGDVAPHGREPEELALGGLCPWGSIGLEVMGCERPGVKELAGSSSATERALASRTGSRLRETPWLNPLPTIGAKLKFRVHGPTATEAFSDELLFGRNPRRSPTLIEDSAAASTFEERPSFPDREEGNKEETHVMVQPHEPGRGESAAGTAPRLVVHLDLPG